MSEIPADVDVAIVGAGAAGLGAGQRLRDLGVSFALLEAAHRVGGRGCTEVLAPGVDFDLGCHWMHSASLNPFVAMADAAGFTYDKTGFSRRVRFEGRWAGAAEARDCETFFDRSHAAIQRAAAAGRDVAVAEVTERESRWSALFDDWVSCTFAVVGPSGRKIRHDVVETNGGALVRYVKDLPGRKHLCLEEVTQSAWLYEILSPHVEKTVVAGLTGKNRGQKDDLGMPSNGPKSCARTGFRGRCSRLRDGSHACGNSVGCTRCWCGMSFECRAA